jgi:hypothetical protein
MKSSFCLILIVFAASFSFAQNQTANPPYKDSSLPVEQRVQDLLSQLDGERPQPATRNSFDQNG